jgi:hypothetical protein
VKLLDGLLIVSQILLTSNQYDGKPTAEMQDFGNPLRARVSVFQSTTSEVLGLPGTVPSLGRYRANPGNQRRSR